MKTKLLALTGLVKRELMRFVNQHERFFAALVQIAAFLIIVWLAGIDIPATGLFMTIPALIYTGLMLGPLGMLLSSLIRQLENFAGVMNFVIFPMFFLSSALYPIWKMRESSRVLAAICEWNPFTHAIELTRFTLYSQFNIVALLVVITTAAVFILAAVWSFDPARRFRAGRTGPGKSQLVPIQKWMPGATAVGIHFWMDTYLNYLPSTIRLTFVYPQRIEIVNLM